MARMYKVVSTAIELLLDDISRPCNLLILDLGRDVVLALTYRLSPSLTKGRRCCEPERERP
jgi:hypothetical protein